MSKFLTEYRTDTVDVAFTIKHVKGREYDPNHPGTEANLDIQHTQAMAYPTPHLLQHRRLRVSRTWYKRTR